MRIVTENFSSLGTHMKSWLLQPSARKGWLISFIAFLGSIPLATIIYDTGLSTFLRKPDPTHTLAAASLLLVSGSIFTIMSYKRGLSIGAKGGFHLLVLALPVWCIALATIPAASDTNPTPLRKVVAKARRIAIILAIILVSTSVAWIFISGGPRAALLSISVQRALTDSDDYASHGRSFRQGAAKLISIGTCDEADIIENGGFAKAPSKAPAEVYFLYCGGWSASHRHYFDPSNGEFHR